VKQLPVACCVPGGVAVARLIRLDGEQGTREMPVISSLRIGRDPRSDWVIDEEAYPEVSRAHTVVSRRGRDYFVADLGSMNGTYLNDRVVQGEQPLNGGDVVTLGLNGPRFRLEVKQG
jgi:pSer/pThr/pTyr-binding forkhead associated (FHA) protein